MATATSAATAALCSARARLAGMLRPAVASAMRPSTNGVTAAPRDAGGLGVGQRTGQHGIEGHGVELVVGGDRHRQQHAGVGPAAVGQHGRDLGGRLDPVRHPQPRRPRVERREPVVAPAEHGDAGRLEVLQRPGQVEERLGAGAHRDERVVGDGIEVGGDVAGDLRRRGARRRCRPWRTRRSRPPPASASDADTVVAPSSQRWARATGHVTLGRLAGRAEDARRARPASRRRGPRRRARP